MADTLVMPKVKGRQIVMATTDPRPGSAPTIMPSITPTKFIARVKGERAANRESMKSMFSPSLCRRGSERRTARHRPEHGPFL